MSQSSGGEKGSCLAQTPSSMLGSEDSRFRVQGLGFRVLLTETQLVVLTTKGNMKWKLGEFRDSQGIQFKLLYW